MLELHAQAVLLEEGVGCRPLTEVLSPTKKPARRKVGPPAVLPVIISHSAISAIYSVIFIWCILYALQHVHIYVYMRLCVCVSMCVSVCVYVCVCVCVCVCE